MADLQLILAGPILWWITKNPRWMLLTGIGLALFALDVVLAALSTM